VGGRFRCLGSSQHLKSKFGMGYQLEVGFRTPTRAETTAWADKIFKANSDPKQINNPLTLVNIQKILHAINLGGQAEAAMHVGETFDEFAVFCFLQSNVDHFRNFIDTEFPGSVMVEKQGMKMRFEVPHSSPQGIPLKLSAMFGTFQKNKETFNVQEYSLSQTSLEQIFNGFASKQEEEQGSAAGIIAAPAGGGGAASTMGNSRNLQHNSNSFKFSNENPAAKHHDVS
jgi:ATP-binding cassette subfamily A (ABC1) protein 3